MFGKKAKAAAAAGSEAAPAKRSKLKIILLAAMPLVGAGGGYAGWIFYAGAPGAEAAHGGAGGHGAAHGQDPMQVAAIPPEVLAETSATYSFALSELVRTQCGVVETKALKAASEAEAAADGRLVNLSWMAANRRLASITEKSCNRILVEIDAAEAKAAEKAAGGEKKAAH